MTSRRAPLSVEGPVVASRAALRPWALKRLRALRRWCLRLPLPKSLALTLGALYRACNRHLLLPELAVGTPFRGVVQLRRRQRTDGVSSRHTVGEPVTVQFTEPRQRRFLRHVYHYRGNAQRFEPAFVATLDRGLLHVPTGGVATASHMLIGESCRNQVEWLLTRVPPPAAPRRHHGAATTILASVSGNYYHWLIDCLPRLWVLARSGVSTPLTVLAPDTLAPFQRSTLQWCLPPGIDVRYTNDQWVQPDSLIFASLALEPATGFLPAECLTYLRERIFAQVGEAPQRGGRRLYIPRSIPGQPRRIVNEEALIERLVTHGFEVCRPEQLSFEEQVQTFRAAEAIVGSRGAALTNMLFGTRLRVLELTAPMPFAGSVYFSLAGALGHDYHYLFARQRVGQHFDVDLERLDEVLKGMRCAA